MYKKCYQNQLLEYRRSIFTELIGFTGCHIYIFVYLYKKCYQNQLLKYRRSIFTELTGSTGCHIKFMKLN